VYNHPSAQRFRLSRGLEKTLIVLILLIAAALRISDLTRFPQGFSEAEIGNIYFSELARAGEVASYYLMPGQEGAREGLYPILTALGRSTFGTGRLPYRAIPLATGLASIALMYVLARRMFGRVAGLAAAFGLAVNHIHIILSRTTVPEGLLLPLLLVVLILITAALHLKDRIAPDPPSTLTYTYLGVGMGILVYAGWTALLIPLLFLIYVIFLIVTKQPISRRIIGFSAYALAITLIVSIPYVTSVLRAPGVSAAHQWWLNRPLSVGDGVRSAYEALLSIATKGDLDPTRNIPGEGLLRAGGLILCVLGLYAGFRQRRAPNMVFALLILIIGLLPDMWSQGPPHVSHSVGALPGLMIFVGVGTAFVFDWLTAKGQRSVAWVVLVILVIGRLVLTASAIRGWQTLPQVDEAFGGRLGHLASYLDRQNDPLTTTICTFYLNDPYGPEPSLLKELTSDSGLLNLMLHRANDHLRFSNCLTGFVLTEGGALQRIAFAHPRAAESLAPVFKEWLSGAQPLNAPGLPPGSVLQVNAEKAVADTFGQTILSQVSFAPETSGTLDQAALPVRMGGYLTFEGYRMLSATPIQPGGSIEVVLYWRADGQPVPGLRFFAHLMRNFYAPPILQNDLISVDSALLRNRDVFVQIISIPLPADFPAGDYWLSIGAYTAIDNTRMPVYDKDTERGSRLFLELLRIGQ